MRNLHTGDEGVLVAFDGHDFAIVQSRADNDFYPMPLLSLVAAADFYGTVPLDKDLTDRFSKRKKQALGIIKKTADERDPNEFPTLPTGTAGDTGVHIAFLPNGNNSRYLVYLINDTNTAYTFDYEYFTHKNKQAELRHSIDRYEFFPIGEMAHADLNESPSFVLKAAALHLEKHVHLKIKSFFNNQKTLALCPYQMTVLTLSAHINATNIAHSHENDLHELTKEHLKEWLPRTQNQRNNNPYLRSHDLTAYAGFPHELDLHYEALVGGSQKMNPRDILPMQIKAFDEYLQRAIILGIPRVFVIHGIGTGKLKMELHARLRLERNIKSFRNEYHAKYEFGATEIIITD